MSTRDLVDKEDKDADSKTKSLPLMYDFKTQLYTLGAKPGMECMPLRSPGPYHYHHVVDQTKSLQELQNEVGALLEFRDLVIETFPDLKTKMANSQANSTITGIPSSSSLASRREWEPGIRVRRKLPHKENSEVSSSSLVRSRSNSHSGKKEPKSGEGNGSVVQDSGFSTETSSSKETHSASSTSGAVQGAATAHRLTSDAEADELWNLLDVIHRKSNRLRDEVEHLRNIERQKCGSDTTTATTTTVPSDPKSITFQAQLARVSLEDVQVLRKERDRLLDKLSEMEAETLSSKIKDARMQDEMGVLQTAKRDLEDQLKSALTQKYELNSKLNDLQLQFVNNSNSCDVLSPDGASKHRLPTISGNVVSTITSRRTPESQGASSSKLINSNVYFTPVVIKSSAKSSAASSVVTSQYLPQDTAANSLNIPKVREIKDSKKIAAILLETNIVELQRNLLTITVQNQVLQQKLDQMLKSKLYLSKQLDKSKEDIDDLRFQLEEKSIELEGARAQLRVIESKSMTKSEYGSPEHLSRSGIVLPPVASYRDTTQISTPSMKAMIPLAMDDAGMHHSSSTESAQDNTELRRECPETPRRRPSKIPLQKSYVAPKPPIKTKSPSGPPSNKSLSKSTGSLTQTKTPPSGPSSITKQSPCRSDSSQSWRNSLDKGPRSSSIPVSAKGITTQSPSTATTSTTTATTTTTQITKPSSPVRTKRDSLTTRVKNLDSLSRMQQQSSSSTATTNPSLSSSRMASFGSPVAGTPLKGANSSSISATRKRSDQPSVPVRRVSSASTTRSAMSVGSDGDVSVDTAKASIIQSSIDEVPEYVDESQLSPRLLDTYLARNRLPPPPLNPPAIFQPISKHGSTPAHINMAYRHPSLLLVEEEHDESHSLEADRSESIIIPTVHHHKQTSVDKCRLVGRVNPNIVRTWEQIKSALNVGGGSGGADSVSTSSEDKQSFTLFCRRPYNFKELGLDKYPVRRLLRPESEFSEDFFDSIDDRSMTVLEMEQVVEELTAAGEGMADGCDSLDPSKIRICWSMDDEGE